MTTTRKSKSKVAALMMPRQAAIHTHKVWFGTRCKTALTVALGVAIPLLSLTLSKLSGSLALGRHWCLSGLCLGLCLSVLWVSLGHLAWAIENITRSAPKQSWALAVTIDLTLVTVELIQVFAVDLDLWGLTTVLMVAVAIFSMVLNVWAFIHQG